MKILYAIVGQSDQGKTSMANAIAGYAKGRLHDIHSDHEVISALRTVTHYDDGADILICWKRFKPDFRLTDIKLLMAGYQEVRVVTITKIRK